jgi:DNA modification methylase
MKNNSKTVKDKEKEYPFISIDELKPYENNARLHPKEQIEKIVNSINEFGFITPVIIDENNTILVGHGRTQAAKEAGLDKVPYRRITNLTEEQKRAYILADNKLSDIAEWDEELLKTELESISLDMTAFGFEDFNIEIEEEEETEVVEDEIPEAPEEARSQLGDLYKLGNHRLYCGDSTDPLSLGLLMNGKKADLVFTDPPYGMKKENEGVLNDNLNYDKLLEFNKRWIDLAFDNLKDNGSFYCWGTDEPLMDIYSNILKPMAKENKITFRNLITWDKGNGQGQLSDEFRMYPIADEKCLFVMAGVQGFNTNADNYFEGWESIRLYLLGERKKCGWDIPTMKTIAGHSDKSRDHWTSKSQWNLLTREVYEKFQAWAIQHNVEAFKREYDDIKREYDDIKREYYNGRAYFNNTHDNMNNVWHFDRISTEERELTGGHATPKPIALCARAIKSSSREGETVLDLFGGSGSTLIACEQLNRSCCMIELDSRYVDVIIKRWETLTGKKAELIKGV